MGGSSVAAAGVASKRLDLLLELMPRATLVGYLDNSRFSAAETTVENLATAARIKGRELVVFDAATEQQIETAFTIMALQRVLALVVSPDPFLTTRQEQIIALASDSMLPTIYAAREGAVVLGGLMSYGILDNDMYRLAGIYAGQILKGATAAESPMMLPTRFTLVVNNGTAKALRIAVPRRLLVRADEIIGLLPGAKHSGSCYHRLHSGFIRRIRPRRT
jgi:putative tryptophan/tyrosine transport system substrate-binding protein